MNVLLPETLKENYSLPGNPIKTDFPVLYLLHGYNGDETGWQRNSSLELYASGYPFAIVMPRVNHGFYLNHPGTGYQYLDFMVEELPQIVSHFFKVSTKPEDTFIGGLSMGGYGAARCALEAPGRYAAMALISGYLDLKTVYETNSVLPHLFTATGGNYEEVLSKDNDIFELLKKRKKEGAFIPELYACCGTEDFLCEHNQNFKNLCENLNIPLHYEEWAGVHDWVFWDAAIKKILAWLPYSKP